ncbi:KGG domain-containing protein [Massilia brevitalea]|uniref:KGG domain-containing protein n=1 Tax=Massilia brevitalea TaxID=442526 RepID=UPI0027393F9B|nr:KGG domain-containing protein [Massilia brevitalea]
MASNNQGGNNGNGGNKQAGNTSNRGFASMDPQRQREIASEGGRAAHASGNAHEFTSEEARRAGSMSHKNDGNKQSGGKGGGKQGGNEGGQGGGQGNATRGGTPEQHARAGSESNKNDK